MLSDDFFTFFTGIYADYDGAYGDQCFDLANLYSRWIGGPRFTGATADLIFQQPGTFYTAIKNSPNNYPQRGDIVVWDWPHVGVATGKNTNTTTFEVLEQNDPLNSDCHLKTYPNYIGVIGWLRPKVLPSASVDMCPQDRDINWNIAVKMATAAGVNLDPTDKQGSSDKVVEYIRSLKAQIAVLSQPSASQTTSNSTTTVVNGSQPTTPPQPPLGPPPVATPNYKQILSDVKAVTYESDPWWNVFVKDQRIEEIKKILTENDV